jgi:hypothetical protein
VERGPGGCAAAELAGIIDELYGFIERSRLLLLLVESLADEYPGLGGESVNDRKRAFSGLVAAFLASRAAAGELRPLADPEIAARFLSESIAWFAQHRKRDPSAAMFDDQQARSAVRELLLAAFVPDAAATGTGRNLLSVGAALGVTNAVFNWGWGSSALGIGTSAPVEVFLPVIMFSVLFGLSTDYEVFLVSRVHEHWVRTGDNRQAVISGQAATGRVITAAASIMILVFLSFVLNGNIIIQQFGVGLAAAIIIDAFVVRTVLVPALMHVFGKANWWLPGWLGHRPPHLHRHRHRRQEAPQGRDRQARARP